MATSRPPTPRGPGQRAGLTQDRVVSTAREMLTAAGPDALTMRALADRLGVAANALYSHVESKTALIDAVLDDALAGVAEPTAHGHDATAGLHALMTSTLEVLLAHPGLVPLYVARQGARGPNAQRLGQAMLVLLEGAGVTGGPAREAQRVLIVYTIGFAAFGARLPTDLEGPVPAGELVASFDRGLRWLLAGITGGTRGG